MDRMIFIIYLLYYVNIFLVRSSDSNVIDYKFSTRTPYRFVENLDLNIGKYSDCEPLKIWMLVRHGTRAPKQDNIDFMLNKLPFIRDIILSNYRNIKGPLTNDEIDAFKRWYPCVSDSDVEKMLFREGEREMFSLGQRTYQRFAEIINLDSRFKTTPTQRAYESAKFFRQGMFGEDGDEVHIERAQEVGDKILRFYKSCERWREFVKKNDFTYYESRMYIESHDMKRALLDMSRRMGLTDTIAYNMAKLIYNSCGFETAWSLNDTVSPWCSLFTNKTIEVFEYADDLKYYWLDGYGNNLTKRLPCKVLDDILNFFRSDNTSTFYFTHSGTLLKTLSYFGLYEPMYDLSHNNREHGRKWRTSHIDAFGSNLAFVLYRCDQDIKFLTLHQERPVTIPECSIHGDLCPIDVLIKKHETDYCNLEEMCKLNNMDDGIKDEL